MTTKPVHVRASIPRPGHLNMAFTAQEWIGSTSERTGLDFPDSEVNFGGLQKWMWLMARVSSVRSATRRQKKFARRAFSSLREFRRSVTVEMRSHAFAAESSARCSFMKSAANETLPVA